MHRVRVPFLGIIFMLSTAAGATIFGSVRGVVHDPQHRPVEGAMVMVKAKSSDWAATANTNVNGEFNFPAIPLGEYTVSIASPGFQQASQGLKVNAGTQPLLHFLLSLAGARESVTVSAAPDAAATDTVTPTSMISRLDVERTPGADRSNSLAVITDYVPGAYMTHDQLHVRGGHQVSWLIDGVPVPNTNIGTNLGPQFDPKDFDYLEAQRGSYGAEVGDRTYGVFNVAPRTGFERYRQAELITSIGNFFQTNDQINFGSHTQRFAYYFSLNGNRSNLGLETPTAEVIHDAENGYGGFGSLILNATPANQLRFMSSLRRDYYQIPYDPDPGSAENEIFSSYGLRDGQHESDALVNFSWVHTFNSATLFTVSPFYHYNAGNYDGRASDFPVATVDDHASAYAGGQATFDTNFSKNGLQVGLYGFHQRDTQLFGLTFNDGSATTFRDRENPAGGLESFFISVKFKPASWVTFIAGMRPTHFSGGVTENSVSPRFGVSLVAPRLNWVFRAFYGHYYQPPPLLTASGPLLGFVDQNNLGFISLRGERDEESQMGVTIPYRGWVVDMDTFRTNARNYFDHSSVGESNAFFPLTIAAAHIRGWELTLRSPRIAHRAQLHLAYSNQVAVARGPITGGLTDFSPGTGFFPLDHDQRNTLNFGGDVTLPWRAFASSNIYYGSGFTNGAAPPPNLPQHTTFDLSLGKDFTERVSASVNALNVANRHLLIDNSVTFGGFHWNNPREVYVELRYRFRY